MKITRLELKDYKCFEHLILENLGERIVLVGPNGNGKSAILEAIVTAKEYISTYLPNQDAYKQRLDQKYTTVWKEDSPLPIRSGQNETHIEMTLSLNPTEQEKVGGSKEVEIGITIKASREVVTNVPNEGTRALLRQHDQGSGIGIFDYIAPERRYTPSRITSLNLNTLSEEHQRSERIELGSLGNTSKKFDSTKQFIIARQLSDLGKHNNGEVDSDSLELLKDLFSLFFKPKQLVGFLEMGTEYQVAVDTPDGKHDIDLLSSGEKELFHVFTNLFRIRDFPSVIIYDEPERHLNPGLEAKLIPALDLLQTRNQLWIATHGTELISSVPLSEIIALRRDEESGRIKAERFDSDTKTEKVRLFEELGANIGLQFSSKRVVFLEGEESNSDKRIIERLVGSNLPGVLFVPSGSSMGVQVTGARSQLLLDKASKYTAFGMVLDRDFRSDEEINEMKRKYNDKVFVWTCHEIENLLLDEQIIFKVLQSSDIGTLSNLDEVKDALFKVASSMSEQFAIEWASYRLFTAVYAPDNPSRPKNEKDFFKMVDNKLERITSSYSKNSAEQELERSKKLVRTCLTNHKWKNLLPGKEILTEFRKKYAPRIENEVFRSLLVSQMIDNGKVPKEIEEFCSFVDSL